MSDNNQPENDQPENDQLEHDQPTHPASRRTLLRAAGLVALTGGSVAAAAGCAADRPVASPSSAPAAPESSSAASTPAAETTPSASASESATKAAAKAPKGPSVATSKVPVGSGVILDGADYVITQPTKGDFKAFSKICTHMKCPVTEVDGRNIVCRCHGSQFSIKDGSVTNPPANDPLAESKVEVFEGNAYVTG